MAQAIVGIGSCIGHRLSVIGRAVALIRDMAGDSELRVSKVFESKAWGYESDALYLNVCVAFHTDLTPPALLDKLQAIERSICSSPHRDDNGNYIDRVIDIDLIAVDCIRINSPELTLPHPRCHLRDFVTVPFMEIAPELCFRICAILTDGD